MSFGAPFGIPFGFAPPTSPALDDPRAQRRRAPVDPNEAPSPATADGLPGGLMPAGLLDAIMRPSAEQGGTAAAPPPNERPGAGAPDFDAAFRTGRPGGGGGGSMSMADQYSLARGMTNLAGRMGTEPQAPQPAQPQQPAQAPQPGAQAAAPPMVAPFSFAGAMPSAPMQVGSSRGFGPGSAGAGLPLPSGGDSLGTPASTGSVAGAQRAQAGRPLPFIGAPRATNPAASPMATSQDGAPLPPPRPTEFGGTGTWAQPEGPATVPQAAAEAGGPAAAGGPSFLERLGQGIGDNADLLTSIGMGLLSTRGLGQGVAVGLKNFQDQQSKKEATGIARAELGLRLQKAAQDATGLKGNQAMVKAAFPDLTPEQLAASSPQLVTAAIAKLQNRNAGRDIKADGAGVQRWVDTGEPVFAGDEGKPDYQLVDVQVGNGQTQKQWLKKGEAGGVPVGQPGQSKPEVRAFKNPDGTESTRVLNQQTGTWEAPNFGANPPEAAAIDPSIPPGVDPGTYRKELAKKTAAQQSSATDRAAMANNIMPILDRAEKAYRALGEMGGIGTINAGWPNRYFTGILRTDAEKMRQEYEATAKELELAQAQIKMKGQGAITEGERKILAFTLPRLDAADPQTGLTTLQGLRDQFARAQQADRLPSYELNAQGRPRGGEKFQQQQLQRRRGSRFDELVGQGMSKEDAFAKMQQEGL